MMKKNKTRKNKNHKNKSRKNKNHKNKSRKNQRGGSLMKGLVETVGYARFYKNYLLCNIIIV